MVTPIAFRPEQVNHDFHWLLVMARMKPGVTLQQARENMNAVTAAIAQAYPKSDKGWGAYVEPLKNDFMPSERITTLWLLLGAVGFILLIACVNVANLLLAKGMTRQKEVAVRSALGATPKTIFAQLITESLLLAIAGGVLGVAVGYGMLRGLVAVMPEGTIPSEADLSLNVPILLFTLLATTLSGLLFGCIPAWYASRVDPAETLKEGGRSGTGVGRHRLRRVLVVGEFALALALLAGAGLGVLGCLAGTMRGLGPDVGPSPETFYADYGTDTEAAYLAQLLADLADRARQNRAGLAQRRKALVFATRAPILLAAVYGLLSLL